ncbi:hypothetical protein HOP50_03g21980 [Chloropicon primus]|nr:hypothetical protein HOP50_03g21980 [Chloropicon primus]
MNTILEKFMFQSKGGQGGGASKTFHEMLGLSSSPPGKNKEREGDPPPERSRKAFENPRQAQRSEVATRVLEASQDLAAILDLIKGGEAAGPEAIEGKLGSLCEKVEAILTKEDAEQAREIWRLGIDVWNAALSWIQSDPPAKGGRTMKQLSCKIAVEVFVPVSSKSSRADKLEIHLSLWRRLVDTGDMWMRASCFEKAEFCFSGASESLGQMTAYADDNAVPIAKREEVLTLLFSLHSKRGWAALELKQDILLSSLVGRCKEMPKTLPPDLAPATLCALAEELFSLGEALLASDRTGQSISMFDSAIEVLGDVRRLASENGEDASKRLKNVLVRITKNLAHAHLNAKNYSEAQAVLSFLRPKLEPIHKHNSFQFMSIKAALGLEKPADALGILESATTSAAENPRHQIFLEMFKACYSGCTQKDLRERVVSQLVTFCERSKNASLVVDFCCFLLSRDAGEVAGTQKYASTVAITGDPKVTVLFNTPDKSHCVRLYGIMFDSAVQTYQGGDYKVSRDLFQTCLLYASLNESDGAGENLRTKVLRCLSLVLLAQKEFKKAEQHIALAKDLEQGNVANDLILIRLHMAQSDYARCLTMIRSLTQNPEFHPKQLLSICREAIRDKQNKVACECLHKLFEHQKQSEEITEPHSTLLRCLISLSEEQVGGDGDDGGGGLGTANYLEEARELYSRDRKNFCGGGKAGARDEPTVHWFACKAWDLGLKLSGLGGREALRAASRMFEASGTFLGDQAKGCEALLYASVLHLDAHDDEEGNAVDDAERLAGLVRSLELAFLKHKRALDEDLQRKIGGRIPWLKYEVACQAKDVPTALQLLMELQLVSEDPAHFVQMARSADVLASRSNAVKARALGIALKCFQGADKVSYEGVAFCLRSLIELRGSDDEGIGLCSQALEVVKQAAAAYPEEEVRWLARTSWNRGVQLYELGERGKGRLWMRVGLDLFPFCGREWLADLDRYEKHLRDRQAACPEDQDQDQDQDQEGGEASKQHQHPAATPTPMVA